MASFMVDLWESIFTPGPTPTILRATNVSFAALQVVLLALLFATFSVHFIILSVLCAGLWWSINWFAAEVAVVQREQKEKEEQEKRQGQGAGRDGTSARTPTAADDSSDTEVEGGAKTTATAKGDRDLRARQKSQQQQQQEQQSSVGSLSPSGTQSSVSTEDEWEKVSEGEKDKSA